MGLLHQLFPNLPPMPEGDLQSDDGGFFDSIGSFFGGSGPSKESIAVGKLVKIVQQGPGTGSLYGAKRATERQMEIQRELSGQAHELTARLETAWTGQSSYGAYETIRSFADTADESSRLLNRNARHIQNQVDSFERMHNSLEPMPDPPPRKGAMDPDFSGRAKKRIRRYEQQAARNRDRYNYYVNDTRDNYGGIEESGPMPGQGGRRPRPPYPTPWGGGGGGPIPVPSSPGGRPGDWNSNISDPSRRGVDMGANPGYQGADYDGTSAAAAYGGAGGPGAGGLGAGGASGVGGLGAGADGMAAGGMAGVAGGAGAGGAGAGGAGAGAGAGAAGRGGAGGRLGGGMMGGGAAGGGRGQGADDQDRERKTWLQENDPEGLFGTDELTAPPVIGDDEYE